MICPGVATHSTRCVSCFLASSIVAGACSSLLEVIIARDNKPVARLVAYLQEFPRRGFGSMRGEAWLDESFWEPLPDEDLKLWEGR
jgi:hypothetical protein